jgi:hypothetical protein
MPDTQRIRDPLTHLCAHLPTSGQAALYSSLLLQRRLRNRDERSRFITSLLVSSGTHSWYTIMARFSAMQFSFIKRNTTLVIHHFGFG